MKRTLTVVLFLCWQITAAQGNDTSLHVTYIGNEGFLLTTAKHKVLLDAIYSDGYGYFAVPPKEVTEDILHANPPFDAIDACLLTHYHKDHCDPVLLNEYLSKHPEVPLVTNKPALVFIDGCCFGFISKKNQLYELTPELNKSVSAVVNNISVKALGIKHLTFFKDSIDLEQLMVNSSYLFEMDGIKIYHSGDIDKNTLRQYMAANQPWNDSIDVAFLYYNLFESGIQDLQFILAALHPKNIILMHIPPGIYDEWANKARQFQKIFPRIYVFKNSLDTRTILISNTLR